MKFLSILLVFFSCNVLAAPVEINKADAKTIAKSLNGIGLKKAEAILQYRKKYGDFKTHKEIANVKGIGKKTVQKNKKDILL